MSKKFFLVSSILFLVSILSLGVYVWLWEVRPHVLEVNVSTVDTSIIIFIRTPENHTILIDGGKTNAVMRTLTSLMPFYRRNIDSVILTKNDDAHAAGLVEVLGRYHVGQVIEMTALEQSQGSTTSAAYIELMKIALQKKVPVRQVIQGDQISFESGINGEVNADILFPPESTTTSKFKFSKTNVPQLALSIHYGETSFVVSDLSKTEQKYVVASTATSTSTGQVALIYQHGGSANAVYENFFNMVHPEYVVIAKKPSLPLSVAAVKKSKKTVFNIGEVAGVSVVNLFEKGNQHFISDGKKIFLK